MLFSFLQILARLANPKEGIYTLQDDSRAIRLGGFMNIPMDRFGIQSPVIIEAVAEIVLADLLHCQDAVFPRFYRNLCQIIVPRPLRSGAGAFDLDRDRGADCETLRRALGGRGVV